MYTVFKYLRTIKNRVKMPKSTLKILKLLIMNVIKIKNLSFFLVVVVRAFGY